MARNSSGNSSDEIFYRGERINAGKELDGPGEVKFIHRVHTSDGRDIPFTQSINVPKELFATEKVGIDFANDGVFPAMQPGTNVPIKIIITSGELYEGDKIQVYYSYNGKEIIVDPPLKYDIREFIFKVPDVDSNDCYLIIRAINGENQEPIGQKVSEKFSIKKKREIEFEFDNDSIVSEMRPGTTIPVRFKVTKGKLEARDRIGAFFSSTGDDDGNKFEIISSNIDLKNNTFDFEVPDRESDNCFLAIAIKTYDDIEVTTTSKRFTIKKEVVPTVFKIDKIVSLKDNRDITSENVELEQGERLEVFFSFSNPKQVNKFTCEIANLENNRDIPAFSAELQGSIIRGNRLASVERRNFKLTLPNEFTGNFKIILTAFFADGEKSSEFSRVFKLKQRTVTIDLYEPRIGTNLENGKKVALKWKIDGPTRDFQTKLIIWYTLIEPTGRRYELIKEIEKADRGVTEWVVDLGLASLPLFIKFELPDLGIEKVFGPFPLVGGRRILTIEDITEHIQVNKVVTINFNSVGINADEFVAHLVYRDAEGEVIEKIAEISNDARSFSFIPKDPTSHAVIKLSAWSREKVILSVESHAFRIEGSNLPAIEVEKIEQELDLIEGIIPIRLPGNTARMDKEVSVGTFLYYLINTNELNNYITAVNKLKTIKIHFESAKLQSRINNQLYQEFVEELNAIEQILPHVEGLQRSKEVKNFVTNLIRVFIPVINKELLDDFKKHFKVDIKFLKAEIITGKDNMDYLSWIIEHSKQIDELTKTDGLHPLNQYLEKLQSYTIRMLPHLRRMRMLVGNIKRELKKRS